MNLITMLIKALADAYVAQSRGCCCCRVGSGAKSLNMCSHSGSDGFWFGALPYMWHCRRTSHPRLPKYRLSDRIKYISKCLQHYYNIFVFFMFKLT